MKILFYGFRHNHIRALYKKALASPQFEIAGCIEPDDAAREAATAALGMDFSSMSYAEWLKTDIDAVAIGCRYGDRGAAVIEALRAGKHVIADKPLCTSLTEWQTICKLSEANDCKIGCMLDLRDLPQVARAKEILDSGRLGTVRNISFNGQHCIDYAHRPAWYFEEGMHGGTVNDLAIHGIDLVRLLTGMEFTHVDAARTWNAYATRHPDFKDCAAFLARLSNGAAVLADISYSAPSQVFSLPSYWEFRIWCDRGLMCLSYNDPAVTVWEEGATEPQRLDGIAPVCDYLGDFAAEVTSNARTLTESVLRSTETALLLQQYADQHLTPTEVIRP